MSIPRGKAVNADGSRGRAARRDEVPASGRIGCGNCAVAKAMRPAKEKARPASQVFTASIMVEFVGYVNGRS